MRSGLHWRGDQVVKQKKSDLNATTVAVDLAKSVFQLAVADAPWRVVETQRLTRTQFERWFVNRDVGLAIMKACGSAHHWARWLGGLGIEVISRVLADPGTAVPDLIRGTARLLIEEIGLLEGRVSQLERELAALANKMARTAWAVLAKGIAFDRGKWHPLDSVNA